MSDAAIDLEERIGEWANEQLWSDCDAISSIIADTNSIFTEESCEDVQLDEIDEHHYSFTAKITMSGEPRKEDVMFCGDTIYVEVTGHIHYDEDEEDWVISDDYEVSAELEDWTGADRWDEANAGHTAVELIAKRYDPTEHIITQRIFDCADKLLIAISELPSESWYRGHGDEHWKLNTAIARQPKAGVALERMLRLEFENQTTFLDPALHPLGIGKCNFLMQHHGLPTRLLDWTTSPLVALYFAVCDVKKDNVDACLWQLDPSQLNRFYKAEYPLECDGQNQDLYREVSDKTLAIHAPYTNLRMKTQRSEFTLHTHYRAIEEDISASVFLKEKLIISKKIKPALRRKLASLGIDRSFLFPDLDNIARTVADNILEDAHE